MRDTLTKLASDIATVFPSVDADTTGQYGAGLGSESEERQVQLLVEALQANSETYQEVQREVPYPDQPARCDLVLSDGTPVEAKLLRYWRANGDPESHWYTHVFSPFNSNTLLTDAQRLSVSGFDQPGGLLGLFYQRSSEDGVDVEANQDRFSASALAEKVVQDIEYWYGFEASVCAIASFSGLQHSVHERGAVITWAVEASRDGSLPPSQG